MQIKQLLAGAVFLSASMYGATIGQINVNGDTYNVLFSAGSLSVDSGAETDYSMTLTGTYTNTGHIDYNLQVTNNLATPLTYSGFLTVATVGVYNISVQGFSIALTDTSGIEVANGVSVTNTTQQLLVNGSELSSLGGNCVKPFPGGSCTFNQVGTTSFGPLAVNEFSLGISGGLGGHSSATLSASDQFGQNGTGELGLASVPEPTTFATLGGALIALGLLRRRK